MYFVLSALTSSPLSLVAATKASAFSGYNFTNNYRDAPARNFLSVDPYRITCTSHAPDVVKVNKGVGNFLISKELFSF